MFDDIVGYDSPTAWRERLDAVEGGIDVSAQNQAATEVDTSIDGDATIDAQPGLEQLAKDLNEDVWESAVEAERASQTKEKLEAEYENFQEEVYNEASEGGAGEDRNGHNESSDEDLASQKDEVERRVDSATTEAEGSTRRVLGGQQFTGFAVVSANEVEKAPVAPSSSGAQQGQPGGEKKFEVPVPALRSAAGKVQECIDEYRPAAAGVANEVRSSANEVIDRHDPDQLSDVNQFAQFALTVMVQLNALGQGLRGLKGLTDQTIENYQSNDDDAARGMSPART